MNHLKISLLIAILPILGFSQSPLSMECDFENGMMGWKGDGRIVEDRNFNKVCSLKKNGSDRREISHVFTLPTSLTSPIIYLLKILSLLTDSILNNLLKL